MSSHELQSRHQDNIYDPPHHEARSLAVVFHPNPNLHELIDGKLLDFKKQVSFVLYAGTVDGVSVTKPLKITAVNHAYQKVNQEQFFFSDYFFEELGLSS